MASPPQESVTESSVFEGLFVRAVQPQGAFAAELRAAGYDLAKPLPRYPTHVWHACLDVARKHVFPALPEEEAEQRLGVMFAEGIFQTLVGKVLTVGMPLLGPAGTLKRLPRLWAGAQPNLQVVSQPEGERHWRVELREAGMRAYFCAGLISALGRHAGAGEIRTKVRSRTHDSCIIDVTW
jgi:uncharacterized protein (TIGR02265 family)